MTGLPSSRPSFEGLTFLTRMRHLALGTNGGTHSRVPGDMRGIRHRETRGDIGVVDLVESHRDRIVRDITIKGCTARTPSTVSAVDVK